MDSFRKRAINGVAWSALERFSAQGISFALSLVIARLVLPSEYGLIAMLSIFLAIAQSFIDSGFSQALIQKQNRTEADFSTVFYFNIFVSVIIYLVLFFCAPLIARFYHEPQLDIITKCVGLNLIVLGFTIVQRAKLTINLDFKTQAKASLLSVAIGGIIGVCLAYYGYGVWALVVQTLIKAVVETILFWVMTDWKPTLTFSNESFKSLFSFGSKLLVSGLLHTIYVNLYSLVIGRFYSATDVGYYNRSYSLAQFTSINATQVITRAIYPMQCEMQNDDEKLASLFHKYIKLTCYLIFPLMIGIAAIAKPLILFLLTEKWLKVAELLPILCLAYMLQPIVAINNQIVNVKGRSDLFLHAEIIKKTVAVIILIASLPFGLNYLCWGILLYNVMDLLIIIYYSKKVITTGYWKQIISILPICVLVLIMYSLIYIGNRYFLTEVISQIFGGILVGIISYIGLSYIIRLQEFKSILALIRRKNG